MIQTTTTRSKPTLRRGFSGLLTAAAVMVVQLWTATPAQAGHTVTITHAPPPVAVAGSDAPLVVAVGGGCWLFCSPIDLQATYWTGQGPKRTIYRNLGSLGPQATVILIPGRHVAKPALSYFLEASQDYCLFDACHTAEARLPESATYSVPVE